MIGVNRSGQDPRGLVYSGASAVYDPLGNMVLDLGQKAATGIIDIELDEVQKIRRGLPFQQDADAFEIND